VDVVIDTVGDDVQARSFGVIKQGWAGYWFRASHRPQCSSRDGMAFVSPSSSFGFPRRNSSSSLALSTRGRSRSISVPS
jgi:hypothetical protein